MTSEQMDYYLLIQQALIAQEKARFLEMLIKNGDISWN